MANINEAKRAYWDAVVARVQQQAREDADKAFGPLFWTVYPRAWRRTYRSERRRLMADVKL